MKIDYCKDELEFKRLYESIDHSNLPDADLILKNKEFCFCFYENDKLLGVIYLEGRDGKVFLSGFSKRKNLKNVMEALNCVCNYFKDDDIYSETPFKHAKLVLKKVGFERLEGNIYIKRKETIC